MPAMLLEPPLDPCRSYAFLYPTGDELQQRRLFVTRIRDANDGSLPEFKWLVTGTDLERQVEESFLFDAMQDVRPLAQPRQLTQGHQWSHPPQDDE